MANQQTVNLVTFQGNVGSISDVRQTPAGRQVMDFSVAHNRSYTRDNGQTWEQETTWARVTVWGPGAAAIQAKLSVGVQVTVIGALSAASAFQSNNGELRASNEIVATSVVVHGANAQSTPASVSEEALPF